MNSVQRIRAARLPLPLLILSIAIPAYAEQLELKDPVWQTVPGTSAAINTAGIQKAGNTIIYEVVNAEAGYLQIQMDCKAQQFRMLRFGFFETRSRVNYEGPANFWSKPANPDQKALAAFVCRLK
ncbi:MAG TPA: hypothetical protein VL134_11410 [Leptolyngbya sp.]|nr:hypothetical protein [Leptolyngbya sp.]